MSVQSQFQLICHLKLCVKTKKMKRLTENEMELWFEGLTKNYCISYQLLNRSVMPQFSAEPFDKTSLPAMSKESDFIEELSFHEHLVDSRLILLLWDNFRQ